MLHWDTFMTKVYDFFNFYITDGTANEKAKEEIKRHEEYFRIISKCIIDTESYLSEAIRSGKGVLLEGANGAMLDLAMGTYPFVTSSVTLACGAYSGLGLSPAIPIYRIGVLKSYTTRVGNGPFPTELLDDNCQIIQSVGAEVGVTTGRQRRCGWLDLVACRFVQQINGFHTINFTKLDVLSKLNNIKVCIDYKHRTTGTFIYLICVPLIRFRGNYETWNISGNSGIAE